MLARAAAGGIAFLYLVTVIAAYYATLKPPQLDMRVGLCDAVPCVSWVMPAGLAWREGVRPGMPVLSVNGAALSAGGVATSAPIEQAEIVTTPGTVTSVYARAGPVGQSPTKFSMWILAGVFALLGGIVITRRLDLMTARAFATFTAVTSVALALGPAAGSSAPEWALLMEVPAFAGVGATLYLFALVLTRTTSRIASTVAVAQLVAIGLAVVVGYVASVTIQPSFYDLVRPVLFFYVAASIMGAIALLSISAVREPSLARRQGIRACLLGIVLGMLPFVAFTLFPEALGYPAVVPVHISILAWGLVPASFAYAMLQYQLMGIRRLVHRGTVNTMAAIALLIVMIALLTVVLHAVHDEKEDLASLSIVMGVLLAVGVLLFFPLQRGARWLVNNLLYREDPDMQSFLRMMRAELLTSHRTSNVAMGIAERTAGILNLESVLFFLGPDPRQCRLVAQTGERASEVREHVYPQLMQAHIDGLISSTRAVTEYQWKSDSLLFVHLSLPDQYVGYMLLGPKKGGEVFGSKEKEQVASIASLFALALAKHELAEELRLLNERLVKAEETERARIAIDLHDGPLQRAMLLAGAFGGELVDSKAVFRELVTELRDICSRLRPAILDDLGLVPALDWHLRNVSERTGLPIFLRLDKVSEEERLSPDTELALFRVAQEATSNAIKHASATSLEVSLSREGNAVVLKVADNGVGFSSRAHLKRGLGLSGMRERLVQVDGSLNIQSVPDLGTTVVARVPLPPVQVRTDKRANDE